VLSGEATNTNFTVFVLTLPALENTIYIQISTGKIYDYQYLSLLLEGNNAVMASVLAYGAVDRVFECR
jgi:hypothetical protein